eukprot:2277294-Amphidinium_carterae.1
MNTSFERASGMEKAEYVASSTAAASSDKAQAKPEASAADEESSSESESSSSSGNDHGAAWMSRVKRGNNASAKAKSAGQASGKTPPPKSKPQAAPVGRKDSKNSLTSLTGTSQSGSVKKESLKESPSGSAASALQVTALVADESGQPAAKADMSTLLGQGKKAKDASITMLDGHTKRLIAGLAKSYDELSEKVKELQLAFRDVDASGLKRLLKQACSLAVGSNVLETLCKHSQKPVRRVELA